MPTTASSEGPTRSEQVELRRKLISPHAQGQLPKSPTGAIYIIKNGHTLLCGFDFANCEVIIEAEDTIVFSGIADSNGIIELPESFDGSYEIGISTVDALYTGIIHL